MIQWGVLFPDFRFFSSRFDFPHPRTSSPTELFSRTKDSNVRAFFVELKTLLSIRSTLSVCPCVRLSVQSLRGVQNLTKKLNEKKLTKILKKDGMYILKKSFKWRGNLKNSVKFEKTVKNDELFWKKKEGKFEKPLKMEGVFEKRAGNSKNPL